MVDVVDRQTRSRMMAGIRGVDTRPERQLRSALHARGFRFRLHDRRLPGKPDIVLPRWSVAILVHGCFWHRHPGCPKATTPASNVEFWHEKFSANVARDLAKAEALRAGGWRVLTVWECAIGRKIPKDVIEDVVAFITSSTPEECCVMEIGAVRTRRWTG
ncbi:very short patch repair endonuclease [Pararhodobacter aggregans]|uniref:very short patch repair endonuclease n=1 Tax=Pararhodobacter aggregans TaxID=404875 RepID=UPI003A8C9592